MPLKERYSNMRSNSVLRLAKNCKDYIHNHTSNMRMEAIVPISGSLNADTKREAVINVLRINQPSVIDSN